MKHIMRILLILFLSVLFLPVIGQELVNDYDGNIYKTIKVGAHVWMEDNLKVTHYSNGDPIPNVMEAARWKILTSGAYCSVINNPANTGAFGLIYNWYSAVDERNVCPTGWHVPSDQEWTELVTFLSGENGVAGIILPGNEAINQSLFKFLPEHFRGFDGEFSGLGYGGGGWWSATQATGETALYRNVNYNTVSRQRLEWLKTFGYNIRCIKD